MDIAQTCNYKVGQFTITFGWQDAPLALRTLAEVLKQNILIGMKICQKASKYLNSNEKLPRTVSAAASVPHSVYRSFAKLL